MSINKHLDEPNLMRLGPLFEADSLGGEEAEAEPKLERLTARDIARHPHREARSGSKGANGPESEVLKKI